MSTKSYSFKDKNSELAPLCGDSKLAEKPLYVNDRAAHPFCNIDIMLTLRALTKPLAELVGSWRDAESFSKRILADAAEAASKQFGAL